MTRPSDIRRQIADFRPDAVHVPLEGPIGLAARLCLSWDDIPFSTAFTTRWPEYIRARVPIPERVSYGYLKWFHDASQACLVANQNLIRELQGRGWTTVSTWSRGVDCDRFRPRSWRSDLRRPVWICVGRVAVEKNIEAFLELRLPGTKVVVGDGPARRDLQKRYPTAVFLGILHGEELVRRMSDADAMVFPSRTDTFGLVILESLACGTPVAAYPVTGPNEILSGGGGVTSTDLRNAALKALEVSPQTCRTLATSYSWDNSIRQFRTVLEKTSFN